MEIIPKEIVENPFKLLPGYGKQIGQVQMHGYHDAASIVEGKVDETNKASSVLSSHSDAVTVFLNEDGRRIGAKTEQTVSGDRINSIPNRIVWTAKKGG